MLNRASPTYPSLAGQAFLGPEMDEFLSQKSAMIAHIRCSSDIRLVTEKVSNFLEGRKSRFQKFLSFCFITHDCRFGSMTKMLRTFIAQIAGIKIPSMNGYGPAQETLEALLAEWQILSDRDFGTFSIPCNVMSQLIDVVQEW